MSAQLYFRRAHPRLSPLLRRPRGTEFKRFCEANPSPNSAPSNAAPSAAVGRAGLHKFSFVFRRLLKFGCFVGVIGGSVYLLHEKEILYKYALTQLKSYKGKTGEDDEKPWFMWNMVMMGWGWSRSWQPYRFYNHLDDLIELLGSDYPDICRQASLMVLMQTMSFDPSMPPPVQYDKCFFKQKLIQSHRGETFMQAVYNLCTCVKSPEIMMMGFDLLMKFPLVPPTPSEEMVEQLMQSEDATREVVFAALQRTQDPLFARSSIRNLKSVRSKLVLPDFADIQRLMLKNRALEFALNLWNSDNNMFKQCGYQMIPSLICGYPDQDELMGYLGDTEVERKINCRIIEEVLMNMGQNHYMRKESEEALKAFEEAEKFGGGKNAPLAFLSGLAYKELGNLEDAETNFAIALALSRGKFTEARLEISNILLKGKDSNDIEKAVQHLQILCQDRNNPKLEEVYFRLLFGLDELKEYELAFEHMSNLARLKPNSQQAKYEAGRMGNMCQEYELAEQFLRQALQLTPASTDTKYQLALALFQQGVIEQETQDLLTSVLKNRPDHVKCLQLQSRIAFERRDFEGSLDKIEKILFQKPNLLSLSVQKAEILEMLFRTEEQYGTYRFLLGQWGYRLSKDPNYFINRPKEQANFAKVALRAKRRHISEAYKQFRLEFTEFKKLHGDALAF